MDQRMKESRLRGSAAYPIVLCEMPRGDAVLDAPMHWQDDVEVLALNRGEVELTLDGEREILRPGDMVWINPGQLHGFRALTPRAQCDVFIFPMNHLLFQAEDHDQQSWLRPLAEGKIGFPPRLPRELEELARKAMQLQKERSAAYEMLTKALLLQLIGSLARAEAFIPLGAAKHEDVCKQILTYIHQHYAEKITVADAAAAAAISPTYFSAFFAKHFFRHFTEYLRHYRIEQACAMLAGTTMSVTEIALASGFSSSSHFIQNFRQVKGITPLAWRRQHTLS